MRSYLCLNKQVFEKNDYLICPIREEDKLLIMKWRNEQLYHLRQEKVLTIEDQEFYFEKVISQLFQNKLPNQILFSFIKAGKCIGYGGLVHIKWKDSNAEISFIMDTELESTQFNQNWSVFLELIEKVAFKELKLHKIFTYAFDLRPHLYSALLSNNFIEEARLKQQILLDGNFIDVLIHCKINE